ncbi:MAG: FAD-dependent oxidoreductase [Acidobacteriota bacterium]
MSLSQLETQVRRDLDAIRYPDNDWVPRRRHRGADVLDVVIVGAGQCGLAAAFALQRERVHNILLVDAEAPGRQGPWSTFARMHTLRSPKHFNGPDLDVPSLTVQSWYEAKYGDEAWRRLHKLPKEDWQAYLLWLTEALELPVRYCTRVEAVVPVTPEDGTSRDDLFRLDLVSEGQVADDDSAPRTLWARKVIFATGCEGNGRWLVPRLIADGLPSDRYTRVSDSVDFDALRGRRVAVLGGGASAYDNAATALERGAASVDLFVRRPQVHRVNPHHWTEFSGFLEHFCDLDDAMRWRMMAHILPMREPSPPETFRRATRFDAFTLHLGAAWTSCRMDGDEIVIETAAGEHRADHVLVAAGLATDLSHRRELAQVVDQIARWSDRYQPPPEHQVDGLGEFPYLGRSFEYVEKVPGGAPFLRHLYNFTGGATLSQGPSGSSINGMKHAARRIASGISHDFFVEDADHFYRQLLAYDVPEMDVPWPPTEARSEATAEREVESVLA